MSNNKDKYYQVLINEMIERYNTETPFRVMVDTMRMIDEIQGFNELDFLAAMNYYTYLKNKGK